MVYLAGNLLFAADKDIFVTQSLTMLTVTYLRVHKEDALKGLLKRGIDAESLIDEIIHTDDKRKENQQQHDAVLADINSLSKAIGAHFKQKELDLAEEKKQQVAKLKDVAAQLEDERKAVYQTLQNLLLQLPNIPHESVVSGKSATDNVIVKEGAVAATPNGKAPHWDIAKRLDIVDFELGNLLTGSGFPVFKGKGARLQRALISYFLDRAIEAGYEEVIPPLVVNEDSAYATGQLPDKEGQMYTIPEDGLFLIPTAEVPITNMFRGALLSVDELPKKCVGYTPCFRREAGSYGKDVRGLNRVHQFDKVEIVQLVEASTSYGVLNDMVAHVESLVQALQLPYRIVRLCGGDMGFTSAMTYDFEVYAAAQDKWLEVSSVSNFETFQSNRLNCRYKDQDNKKNLVHTLNGSALALPRILAAILENYQDTYGVVIPDVLKPYTGFDRI